MLLPFALAACGHTDDYPMYNPETKAEVVCHSGIYFLHKDEFQQKIADDCIAACARHGFDPAPKGSGGLDLFGQNPNDDVRGTMPLACLP